LTAHGLIDTTEMYLRTIFELEEEGIVPLRARIAERLSQSGPTVSQTVARMERDGLVRVEGDRHLDLTDTGRSLAVRVMRKHRLAECLLVNVIGLPWEDVHVEACRWEHVMSEEVERRLVSLLGDPSTCPHGNPIPGLGTLNPDEFPLDEAQTGDELVIQRITEEAEQDLQLMKYLQEHGVEPGARMTVREATRFNALVVLEGPHGPVPLGFPVAAKLRARRV
jgi:DtxR family transcriptional regulator, Mn-dependent transcriptional regulator